MLKQFCPYCGRPLSEECECEQFAADEEEEMFKELEWRSMENAWQQDIIDLYRREK